MFLLFPADMATVPVDPSKPANPTTFDEQLRSLHRGGGAAC
jgi:hypothetical protein